MANAMSRICTGMISERDHAEQARGRSAGSAKPALSRSNQLGAATSAKIEQQERERGGHRQHAAVPACREVRQHT